METDKHDLCKCSRSVCTRGDVWGDYPRPLWLHVALDMCCDAPQRKKVARYSQEVRAVDFSTRSAFLLIEFTVKLDA